MLDSRLWAVAFAFAGISLGVFAIQQPPGKSKAPKTQAPKAQAPKAQVPAGLPQDVVPLFKKYCVACHVSANAPGGIDLAKIKTQADLEKHLNWVPKIASNIRNGTMPPAGLPKPTAAEKAALLRTLDALLAKQGAGVVKPTLRRLNRSQYNRTVKDLVGIDYRPADDFPSDDVGYGFDNIGDVLSISPLHAEKYLSAAEQIATRAIVLPGGQRARYDASRMRTSGGVNDQGNAKLFYSAGTAAVDHHFPAPGNYRIRIVAFETPFGPERAKLELRVGGQRVAVFDVDARDSDPKAYEAPYQGDQGSRPIEVLFINDAYEENKGDRNAGLVSIEVAGPAEGGPKPASHRRLVFTEPGAGGTRDEATRKVLARFVPKAWRRPVESAELDRLVALARRGDSYERGLQMAVAATLASPHFLFLVETGPNPNPHQLATRLSYFLWGTMPDEALLAAAADGSLARPDVLKAHTARMLKDPKAAALAEDFAGQWLQTRKLYEVTPNPDQFPNFTPALRDAMAEETRRFFMHVVAEDRPILDFLVGDYTFVNAPLAKHYGLSHSGDGWQRVSLPPDSHRAGVLTQGSVLVVTSNPTRTSPVKRGKWVLENILGTPPPPPPPNVGVLKDDGKPITGETVRKRLEEHRAKPECAQCHARMDPIGFAMENFDAIGAWRDKEGDLMLDVSGVLPDGAKFNGPDDLRRVLLGKKDQFAHALSEKMLTFALGRGAYARDKATLDAIAADTAKGGYRFSALVQSLVASPAFRGTSAR